MVRAVIDFPEPDSPTTPRTSPLLMVKLALLTALFPALNSTLRLFIFTSFLFTSSHFLKAKFVLFLVHRLKKLIKNEPLLHYISITHCVLSKNDLTFCSIDTIFAAENDLYKNCRAIYIKISRFRTTKKQARTVIFFTKKEQMYRLCFKAVIIYFLCLPLSLGSKNQTIVPKPYLTTTYTKNTTQKGFLLPSLSPKLLTALRHQRKLIETRSLGNYFKVGNLTISKQQLKRTITAVEHWNSVGIAPLAEYFEIYQLRGEDNRGNVKFTGYYSPVVTAREQADEVYRYPIYAAPTDWQGKLPTRKQISEGALKGKGLEIAYVKSNKDVYQFQMQGSGYIQYPNGKMELISYHSSNGHSRRILDLQVSENYTEQRATDPALTNFLKANPAKTDDLIESDPSYVFFKRNVASKGVMGSGSVPLTEDHSVAVDPRFVPLGACLFANVPTKTKTHKSTKLAPRLLLAQDTGGGVRGRGHVDLYTGTGLIGKKKSAIRHHGQIWLLLGKKTLKIES